MLKNVMLQKEEVVKENEAQEWIEKCVVSGIKKEDLDE